MESGKVLDGGGRPVDFSTPYEPGAHLTYFREVKEEPVIPFKEKILYQDSHLLVACKPHFLPVIPAGSYVNECLLHRLKKRTSNPELVPINRIDRETAGLVLFSVNPETRGAYQSLFMAGRVEKTYLAVTRRLPGCTGGHWVVENRIQKGEPWFRNRIVPGRANSLTRMEILEVREDKALFKLMPGTGKKHQLRIHLSHLGFPILNDRFYPGLQPECPDDFSKPLQLLAGELVFTDPVSREHRRFVSPRSLDW